MHVGSSRVLGTFFRLDQFFSPVPSGLFVIPLVSLLPCVTDSMSQHPISL